MSNMNDLLWFFGELALRAALLLGAARAITSALRRASAALRHLVWLLALCGLLLLPVLTAILPAWHAAVYSPHLGQLRETLPAIFFSDVKESATEMTPADLVEQSTETLPVGVHGRWPMLIIALWFAGAAAVGARTVFALLQLRRIGLKVSHTFPGAHLEPMLRECALHLGIRVPIALRFTKESIAMPMTWGFRRPFVVLPAQAAHWNRERVRAVLLHELAHVRRGDWLVLLISTAACALFWFHPLVWMAARALRYESERAADDAVIAAGIKPSTYSAELLAIVQFAHHINAETERNHPMIAAIPMAKVTTVEHRIRALLDHRRSRSGLTRLHAIAAFSAAVAIVLPLAMVSLRAIDSPGTPTASADGALPDRTTPESAINSFVDALNRFDLRSARACIFGVNPAAVSPEFERQLKQVRPILTLRDVRTVTEGERSIVMIGNGTVSDSDNVSDKDRPSVHSVKDQRLELRRDGGVWRIVPGDLKHIDRAGGEPALAGIVAILAAPEPALAHARVKAQATLCANHLRQLAVAAHMYANAHAGRLDFAPGDPATALAAYTDNQKVSSCPDAVSKTPYRFNAKLVDAEIDRIAEPNKTVLFYEPAAIGAQLDYHHNDRTNIAFVDGHVQACDREETAKLRWDP